MSIPLPAGTRVSTRLYAPIAHVESFDPSDWPQRMVPAALLSPGAQQPAGLTVRIFTTEAEYNAVPPGEGFASTTSRVEIVALAGRMAFVEVSWQWIADTSALITAESIRAHWIPMYAGFRALEDTVLTMPELRGRHSAWQFPMTLIAGEKLDGDDESAVAFDAVGQSGARASSAGIRGAMSWDGAVYFLQAADTSKQEHAAAFLMRAICADWEFHEEALQVSRRELIAESSLVERLGSIRKALRRIYTSLAIVDPASICYQESHRQLLQSAWKGWGRAELHSRATAVVDRVHQFHELDVELDRAEAARRSEARGDVLNRIVGWLGLFGVGSTVAGILSTVDYENDLLDRLWRVLFIGGTTAITLLAFGTLFWRAGRVGRGKLDGDPP